MKRCSSNSSRVATTGKTDKLRNQAKFQQVFRTGRAATIRLTERRCVLGHPTLAFPVQTLFDDMFQSNEGTATR